MKLAVSCKDKLQRHELCLTSLMRAFLIRRHRPDMPWIQSFFIDKCDDATWLVYRVVPRANK